MREPLVPAHGGALVDLLVHGDRAVELSRAAAALPSWTLDRRQRCDLEMLATGAFSPLAGFLQQADYDSVCTRMRLADGSLWPVPVTLAVPEDVARAAQARGGLALHSRDGLLAVLHAESVFRPDRRAEAAAVYGTTDRDHPGVHALLHGHAWYVGGRVDVLRLPVHRAFTRLRHTPAQVREELRRRDWHRVVAFQTRNPMHRAHQELTLRAARDAGAKLLLHPVVGMTKPGDVDPYVRVRCYQALLPSYGRDQAMLSLLPLAMRMAGPREALWHAIIRKNHGATHFIVGRDHAGPGPDAHGRPFYEPYAAQDLVRLHEAELGVCAVPFRKMVFVQELDGYLPEDEVGAGATCLHISGTEQRRRLALGLDLPAWFTPPAVAQELRRAFPARSGQGLSVVLHGDASACAQLLAADLKQAGRRVTLLDRPVPDAAPELLEALAQLVGEIVRNGGVVLCAGPAAALLRSGDPRQHLQEAGPLLDVVQGHAPPPVVVADAHLPALALPADAGPEPVCTAVVGHLRRLGFVEQAAPGCTPGATTDAG